MQSPERAHLDGAYAQRAREAARRSRRVLLLIVPLTVAVLGIYAFRVQLLGADHSVRVGAAIVLVALGWPLAANLTRALVPRLTRHVSRGAAEASLYMVRLLMLGFTVLVSLRIAGVAPGALIAGASMTAIVLGLAAQQTFGNLFAGIVLLGARPFEVGDRVRFNGFGMDVEGVVASRGMLYVTMEEGEDLVRVPNATALTMSVRPLREPAAVDMRARLSADTDPETVQRRVSEAVSVLTRGSPDVHLEEFDGDEVIVRVRARPKDRREGGALARQVLRAVSAIASSDGAAPG